MTRNETVDAEVTSLSCDGAVKPRRVQELLSGFVMQPEDYTDLETSIAELRKEEGKKTQSRCGGVCSQQPSCVFSPRPSYMDA